MKSCIEWEGSCDSSGYGIVTRAGKQLRVHRVRWEQENGPIPAGMIVMHSCDNPPCFNLKHLKLGTHADNQKDKTAKGRQAKGEKNGRAKLSMDEVKDILDMAGRGQTKRFIARLYHVDPAVIRKIVRGEMWKEVPRPEQFLNKTCEKPPVSAGGSSGEAVPK